MTELNWTVAHQAPLSMGFSWQEYWRTWGHGAPSGERVQLAFELADGRGPVRPEKEVMTLIPGATLLIKFRRFMSKSRRI